MTVEYAVLKGRVVGSVRTEVMEQRVNAAHLGNGPYRSNHFHLLVQAADGLWRCPVNVRSQDGSEVWFNSPYAEPWTGVSARKVAKAEWSALR